jgi:hypothetical protein
MFSTSKKCKQQPSTRVVLQEKQESPGHCLTDKNMLPEYTSMPQNTIKLIGYTTPLNTAGRKHASEHHKTDRIGRYLNTIYLKACLRITQTGRKHTSFDHNNADLAENTPHLITIESFIGRTGGL